MYKKNVDKELGEFRVWVKNLGKSNVEAIKEVEMLRMKIVLLVREKS